MKCTVFILLLLNYQSSLAQISSVYFEPLLVKESCEGQRVKSRIVTKYFGEYPLNFTFKDSNIKNLIILSGDAEIQKDGHIVLLDQNELDNLYAVFKIDESNKSPFLVFEQEIENVTYLDTIHVETAQFFINSDIKSLKISDACKETVTLNLPSLGTQTDVAIYEWINKEYQLIERSTYYCCGFDNQFIISKNKRTKYKFQFSGCHSAFEIIEIEIE